MRLRSESKSYTTQGSKRLMAVYIRVKLDVDRGAAIPPALREMFDDGQEDDFETHDIL